MEEEIKPRKRGNPNWHKGHTPEGNAVKGAKMKRTQDKEFFKKTIERYTMKVINANKIEITAALIDQAKKGNVNAIKEAFDRGMGKAISSVELAGKNGAPINVMSFRDLTPDEKTPGELALLKANRK